MGASKHRHLKMSLTKFDRRETDVLRWILADTDRDYGQLWSLATAVRDAFGIVGWQEVRDRTLDLVRPLVERGAIRLGDWCEGPLRTWKFVPRNGAPEHQIALLREAWNVLAEMPRMGDLAWYDLTENGRRDIEAAVARNGQLVQG